MKTTEIAAYIASRNVRLYVGQARPFLPLCPTGRTNREAGWIAFQLVAACEHGLCCTCRLYFNKSEGAFGFFQFDDTYDDKGKMLEGWEQVEFDGFGELESWKEVGV